MNLRSKLIRRGCGLFLSTLVVACGPDRDSAGAEQTSMEDASIEIEYVAHASFRFRGQDGTELLIDPYASRVWLGYDWPDGIEPDGVLITHPHYDHDAGRYRDMPFPWDESVTVVDKPGTRRFGDFTVTGVEGKHADPYGMEFGQLNTLMVIEAYGLRIAHLGDNGPLTAAMISGLGRVDVLMLPGDGVDHILSKETTAEIIERLDPAIVIPMHYRLPDLEATADGPSDLGEIDPWLIGREGVQRVGSHRTRLSSTDLPEERRILVFDHAPYVMAPTSSGR